MGEPLVDLFAVVREVYQVKFEFLVVSHRIREPLEFILYTPPQRSGGGYTGIAMAVPPSVCGHKFVRTFSPTVLHVLL